MVAKKVSKTKTPGDQDAPIARNKKARFKYELLERYEAGLVLKGSEIKSVRNRDVTLDQSFGRFMDGELYVVGMNIAPYEQGGYANHEPLRPRKLLLHRRQIGEIVGRISMPGYTLVPVSLYLKRGLAKLQLAIGRGKRQHDKRETIKRRDAERQIRRAMARGRRGES